MSTFDAVVARVMAHPEMADEHLQFVAEDQPDIDVARRELLKTVKAVVRPVMEGRDPMPHECGYGPELEPYFEEETRKIVRIAREICAEGTRLHCTVRSLSAHAPHAQHVAFAQSALNAPEVQWTFPGAADDEAFVVEIGHEAAKTPFVPKMLDATLLTSGVSAVRLDTADTRTVLELAPEELDRIVYGAVQDAGLQLAQDDFLTVSVHTAADGMRTAWLTCRITATAAANNMRQILSFAARIESTWEEVALGGNAVARYMEEAVAFREGALRMLGTALSVKVDRFIHLVADTIVETDSGVRVQQCAALHDDRRHAVFGAPPCALVVVKPAESVAMGRMAYVPSYPGTLAETSPFFTARCGESMMAREVFSGDALTPASSHGIPAAWASVLVPRVAYFPPSAVVDNIACLV